MTHQVHLRVFVAFLLLAGCIAEIPEDELGESSSAISEDPFTCEAAGPIMPDELDRNGRKLECDPKNWYRSEYECPPTTDLGSTVEVTPGAAQSACAAYITSSAWPAAGNITAHCPKCPDRQRGCELFNLVVQIPGSSNVREINGRWMCGCFTDPEDDRGIAPEANVYWKCNECRDCWWLW